MFALPFPTRDNKHPDAAQIQAGIARIETGARPFLHGASDRIRDIYKNILKLRAGPEETDRLTLVWDSAGDLATLLLMAREAVKTGISVHVIYYRSISVDDGSVAYKYLAPLTDLGVRVDLFDYLISSDTNQAKTVGLYTTANKYLAPLRTSGIRIDLFDYLAPSHRDRIRAIELFCANQPTVYISNLSDAYDLRSDIVAACSTAIPAGDPEIYRNLQISGLEIPTMDLPALTSGMFAENRETMQKCGNEIIAELDKYSGVHLVSADDLTDLYITPNRKVYLNEANNRFDIRPSDYRKNPELLKDAPPCSDNPPGEVYTDIRTARGRLVLYQVDTDVIKFAFRTADLYGFDLANKNPDDLVYDPTDPISLKVNETGHVIPDSITGPGIRSRILKQYLVQKVIEDEQSTKRGDIRRKNAALKFSELGLGINSRANNPEQPVNGLKITSVLITEKLAGVYHLAIGSTPIPDPELDNISASHIDNGLRNDKLQVYGVDEQGRETLLSSNVPGQSGEIDKIFARYFPSAGN